ncbi:MAG: hypothetical protein ACJA01_002463 [Saprospiraceae bacterium]|jgi:hypothetical protein
MKSKTPYILLNQWKSRLLWNSSAISIGLFLILLFTVKAELVNLLSAIVVLSLCMWFVYKGYQSRVPNMTDALNLAHIQNAKLEYSSELLLEDRNIKGLVLYQKIRIKEIFGSVDYKLPWDLELVKDSMFLLFTSLFVAMFVEGAISNTNKKIKNVGGTEQSASFYQDSILYEKDTTFISKLLITTSPPAYTRHSIKKSYDPNLEILEGSSVTWQPEVSGLLNKFYFKLSDADTIEISKNMKFRKTFNTPEYYQFGFYSKNNNFVSDFYGVKIIADQKPEIEISGINEYVRLPWDRNHRIPFEINISDDYGLSEAYILATIAKGSGEAVKFRERKFDLDNFNSNKLDYQGTYTFETEDLDMHPGDELYFHVRTNDNYPYGDHSVKSVTHFITIEDTSTYELVESGGMQVELMPDFFRSQRQIIIDSEKLLEAKSLITVDSFKRASNVLGFDQKMLRLKYGQFLGEENESGIAINNSIPDNEVDHNHDHDHESEHNESNATLENARGLLSQFMHDHDHEEEGGQLLASKGTESDERKDPARPTWVEELSHNHDDSEVATFHDISVKSKLKSALSVMWDSELYLRLYDPSASLPYQYRSLELLQEIKNHARIYVHRLGFESPAIKDRALRLSGDQEKIQDRVYVKDLEIEDEYELLRQLVGMIENGSPKDLKIYLEEAIIILAKVSFKRPEVLPVLTMTNRLHQNSSEPTMLELLMLRTQIIKILPKEADSVGGEFKNAHELTLSVAKKVTF